MSPRTKSGRSSSFWFSCFHAETISHSSSSSPSSSSSQQQELRESESHDAPNQGPFLLKQQQQQQQQEEEPTCHELSSSSSEEDDEMSDDKWDLHIRSTDETSLLSKETTEEERDVMAVIPTDEQADHTTHSSRTTMVASTNPPTDNSMMLLSSLDIPQDVFHEICHYLRDPITLCHVACVSKDLHQRVLQDVESSTMLWKPLYDNRWTRSSYGDAPLLTTTTSTTTNTNASTSSSSSAPFINWNKLFQQRYAQEGHVIRTIQRVVEDELEPDAYDFSSLQQRSNGRIASTYIESADWKQLIHYHDSDDDNNTSTTNNTDTTNNTNNIDDTTRVSNILDVLCAIANMEVDYHPMLQTLQCEAPASRWPLFRFVAASAAFTFHCQEIVSHMNQLCERSVQQQLWNPSFLTTPKTQLVNEEIAIVLAHALRTIPDVLNRSSSLQQCQRSVSLRLDEIANTVQQYLQCLQEEDEDDGGGRPGRRNNDTRTLLQTIHYVLSTEYGIRYQYPLRRRAGTATTTTTDTTTERRHEERGGCDDMAVHCCSIAHVLLCHEQQCQESASSSSSSTSHENCCHPVLVAIIYQAVARRLGLLGDILFCPQNCHSILRFSGATESVSTGVTSNQRPASSPTLLFLDLVEDPGRIMTLAQCKELVHRCDLMTEQTFQDRRRHLNIPWPNHIQHNDDDDDEEDWREDADAFCFQPSMTVQNVIFWLISPFLVSRQDDGMMMDGAGDDWPEAEEDQPYDFILGQLIEGNGGSLLSFLQDRLVFFSAIMRHCKLIP